MQCPSVFHNFGGGIQSIVDTAQGLSLPMPVPACYGKPPSLSAFNGLAFFQADVTVAAPRLSIASWHSGVSQAGTCPVNGKVQAVLA
jgi:hypothetical protein